jgi:mycofactocin precursor
MTWTTKTWTTKTWTTKTWATKGCATTTADSLGAMDDTTVAEHDTTISSEHAADIDLLEDELLVEEISIDGMCGVY